MGRRVGVSRPTTLSRQKLIEGILAIADGAVTPVHHKRGKPPHSHELNDEQSAAVEEIMRQGALNRPYSAYHANNSPVKLTVHDSDEPLEAEDGTAFLCEGYAHLHEGQWHLYDAAFKPLLALRPDLTARTPLREGVRVGISNRKRIREIISIDGIAIEMYAYPPRWEVTVSTGRVAASDAQIPYGSRVFVSDAAAFSNALDATEYDRIITAGFVPDAALEQKLHYRPYRKNVRTVEYLELRLATAMRLAEQGQDVLFFVCNDDPDIANTLFRPETLRLFGRGSEGGSITLAYRTSLEMPEAFR